MEKNTRISVPMNIVIPWLSARFTSKVWSPASVASRAMSRHQRAMVISTDTIATSRLGLARVPLLKNATAQMAKLPSEKEAAIGHTEGLSK